MPFLDAGDIALMRDVVETTLAGTAVIQRSTGTTDGMGGSTRTYAASGTVSARIDPVTLRQGGERQQGGRAIGESNWVVVMPQGTDVQRTDRIVISGGTFEVAEIRTPQTWELLTRAECVRLA